MATEQDFIKRNKNNLFGQLFLGGGKKKTTQPVAPTASPTAAPTQTATAPQPKTETSTRRVGPRTGTQQAEGGGPPPGSPDKTQAQIAQGTAQPGQEVLNDTVVGGRNLTGQALDPSGNIIRGGEAGPLGFQQGTTVGPNGEPISSSDQALLDAGLPIPPKLPEFQEEFQRDVDRVTDERLGAETRRVEEQTETAQEARDISAGIKGQVADVQADTGAVGSQLAEEQQTFQQDLDTRRQELSTLASDVKGEFDDIRGQFSASVQGAISDIEGAQAQALNGVYQGQSAAMQAAVQGIQGNINTQIAQIDGNPNLTAAQKQQMRNQVRMTGAMALAPAVGATQLQFNTLAANVNTQFGQILGQVETAGLAGETQLGTAGGQAFAAASNAMNQMSNAILDLSQSANLAFAASQESLIGLRNLAENSGNQLLNQILPETTMPYHDYGDIFAENLQNNVDLLKLDTQTSLEQFGLEAVQAQMALAIGTPNERLFEAALAGFQAGGGAGALLAGAGALLSQPTR